MTWHLGRRADGEEVRIDGDDLTTHGVIVGMTGSGKTGLGIICLEEALLSGVPVLAIDPKGDLANLALVFPDGTPEDFAPWVDPEPGESRSDAATGVADAWRTGLEAAGIGRDRLAALASLEVVIHTPGSTRGRPLSLLASLAPPDGADPEAIRDEARALVSSVLLMAGIEADPVADPRHVLLATIVEAAWSEGRDVGLEGLIAAVLDPPIRKIGVFEVDRFIPGADREDLALRLNGLIASPTAAAWTAGDPLDIDRMLGDGPARATVVSIAHLDDEARQFVVATLLSKVVSWARRQPGTDRLRALIYMDEVFGFAPPTANPPAKEPILTLLKQGRAHGVGLIAATQNPMDLDYKAMSNAGTWMVGRLQTERDQARVLDGMRSVGGGSDVAALSDLIAGLDKRQFVLHSTRRDAPVTFATRWAMSYLAGPLSDDGHARLKPPTSEVPSAPEPDDDRLPIAPAVAGNAAWVHPSAPWLREVGGGTGTHFVAGVVARVSLRYDDHHAGVDHTEEWEAVWPEAPSATDPGPGVAVDHDDRDFSATAPDGATYEPPSEAIGDATYWKTLERSLLSSLVAARSVTVWKNQHLKLYSRVGEGREEFVARCTVAAESAADTDLAKLRDRYETRVRTARERLRTAEARADALAGEVAADRQDEVISGVGDLIGLFAGGRSGSAGLRRAARRRSDSARTEQRLGAAEDTVAARMADIDAIELDLARDVEGITAGWEAKAADLEEVAVGLESSDVRILDLRLAWLPR